LIDKRGLPYLILLAKIGGPLKAFLNPQRRIMEGTTATAKETPPPLQMLQVMSGFWVARSVYILAKLGIADLIKDRPLTADQLATATGSHGPSLFRVLRALAAVGIVSQDEQNRFGATPLSDTLRSDVGGSLRAFAIAELGEEHYPAWGELLYSVQTGGIAFNKAFGEPVFDFFASHPENAKMFNDAMSSMTAQANEALHGSYSFAGTEKIVDVGGGHGGLITSILQKNPQMKGILFDSPQVIEGADAKMAASGVADRCELAGGDFFQSVPTGADTIILKWIIHDWNDEQSVAILKNCHRALPGDGKLILVEALVPETSEMHFSKFIDLNMLVMTGGRERTEKEFRRLFEDAGFKLTRIVSTESPFSVIEGVKA
jgi:ubiquinone/menaquinone biosynthesis C-methylase UbiE